MLFKWNRRGPNEIGWYRTTTLRGGASTESYVPNAPETASPKELISSVPGSLNPEDYELEHDARNRRVLWTRKVGR